MLSKLMKVLSQMVSHKKAQETKGYDGNAAGVFAAYFGTWREGEVPTLEKVLKIIGNDDLGETLTQIIRRHQEKGIVPPVLQKYSPRWHEVSVAIGDLCRGGKKISQ